MHRFFRSTPLQLALRATTVSCVRPGQNFSSCLSSRSCVLWRCNELKTYPRTQPASVQMLCGSMNPRRMSGSPSGFSHIDPSSNNPTMVNVSDKKITTRTARACSMMRMPPEIMSGIDDDGEIRSKKGPVFATAVIAGTMAAKRTHDLIPFCHPLGLESCKIYITVDGPSTIQILCDVTVTGKTGVEMEALTGASVAALAVYDMCKGVSHDMEIVSTRLITKTGGKSDINAGKAVPE